MEDSFISLDVYPILIEYLDWNTLQNFKKSNNFCYILYKNEKLNRICSYYPFGERNALIKIKTDDIYLEKIYCIISDKEVEIKPEKYSMPYVSEILNKWFHYSLRDNKWLLTGKIINSVIRLCNRLKEIDKVDITELTFSFKDKKSFLIKIDE